MVGWQGRGGRAQPGQPHGGRGVVCFCCQLALPEEFVPLVWLPPSCAVSNRLSWEARRDGMFGGDGISLVFTLVSYT